MITRRNFLAGTAAASLALGLRRAYAVAGPKLSGYPFQLGVASGDPDHSSVVIWTRLATSPRVAGGGMGSDPVTVKWEVAADEHFTDLVKVGESVATAEWAHSVHVEVHGLEPDRWYWYRFTAAGERSPVGRTRTFPARGRMADRLRFAYASCQKYEIGYYTAYEHLSREPLDLIIHLGDYIYEKGDGKNAVRPHHTPEIFSLDDYRVRYGIYKSDDALKAAHACAPWLVTWDDHELSNNYADETPQYPERTTAEAFLLRRMAAYQAYYEHMPLRRASRPERGSLSLYRRVHYGDLAQFDILDTRQYRSDQANGDGIKPPGDAVLDPSRTMLGKAQREWLFAGLASSRSAWSVMAQQVMFARVDVSAGDEVAHSMDKWSGYEYERRAILRHLRDAKVRNPVVLTGDIHSNWANDLMIDFDEGGAHEHVCMEFVGTSITSSGDGQERPENYHSIMGENPCVRFHNTERGYVYCDVTPSEWMTYFRTVPYVSRPGAPLNTRYTHLVEPRVGG